MFSENEQEYEDLYSSWIIAEQPNVEGEKYLEFGALRNPI